MATTAHTHTHTCCLTHIFIFLPSLIFFSHLNRHRFLQRPQRFIKYAESARHQMVRQGLFGEEIRWTGRLFESWSLLSTAWQIMSVLDYGIRKKIRILQLAHKHINALQMWWQVLHVENRNYPETDFVHNFNKLSVSRVSRVIWRSISFSFLFSWPFLFSIETKKKIILHANCSIECTGRTIIRINKFKTNRICRILIHRGKTSTKNCWTIKNCVSS